MFLGDKLIGNIRTCFCIRVHTHRCCIDDKLRMIKNRSAKIGIGNMITLHGMPGNKKTGDPQLFQHKGYRFGSPAGTKD